MLSESTSLGETGIREFREPDIGTTAIGFEVGLSQRVRHVAPIGRHLRVGDS
jgi:hypothetical protein